MWVISLLRGVIPLLRGKFPFVGEITHYKGLITYK